MMQLSLKSFIKYVFFACCLFLIGACKGNAKVETAGQTAVVEQQQPQVPEKVTKVLSYVKANGKAPAGYVGGRAFKNYEKRLPIVEQNGKKIRYQEWDVNPLKQHANRGAERLITGSDGKAWYTEDHYKNFIEIK